MRIHSNGYWFRSLVQVSIPKFWCWRRHISETIWTTETSFAPFGSATISLAHRGNRTRISPTVSEIFDWKNSPERGYFFILFLILILIPSFRQKLNHVSPPTGMVRSWKFRHHIKARDRTKRISDFGGKIPTRWFPMREIIPHYKHRRRGITYFLREIPVKNRERCGRSQQTGKLSGKFFCLIFASSSAIRRPNAET